MLEDIKSQLTIKRMFIGAFSLAALIAVLFFGWILYLMQGLPSASQLAQLRAADYEPRSRRRRKTGCRVRQPAPHLCSVRRVAAAAGPRIHFSRGQILLRTFGCRLMGMLRGTLGNLVRGRRMAGGSTITQQVVKNMLVGATGRSRARSRESCWPGRIEKQSHQAANPRTLHERELSRRQFLVGCRRRGAERISASRCRDLTLAECAMLAACLSARAR